MLRLEMLAADYGDCLWLEYGPEGDTRVIIIDGGPEGTYQRALRPRIENFIASRSSTGGNKLKIELLVVTHIDNDHIIGALNLLQDKTLDIEIGEVWFNGWDEIAELDQLGFEEGVDLSKAIIARGLAHNTAFGGRAVRFDEKDPARKHLLAGGLALTVLSPGRKQLLSLRKKWKTALAEAAGAVEKPTDLLGSTSKPDVEKLAAKPFKADAAVANGSSIVLLVEYQGHRILLAADSFPIVVCDSLSRLGYSEQNRLQLDAYKVAHHGSRGNNSNDIFRMVDCSNFLFSTSGARFGHPHDECIARILVQGGRPTTVLSNYRRDSTVLWNIQSVKKTFHHRVIEPAPGEDVVVTDINVI